MTDDQRWSDSIPPEIQDEIGEAIRLQQFNLPANLLIEWYSPTWIEQRWFVEASQWIDIPYPEYWRPTRDTPDPG